MSRRRGRGEGSITRRPDGRWVARVDLGWRDGKRQRKAVYGRTRREAADKLTTLLAAVQRNVTIPDERETVAQFLERWLSRKREQLRPRTWVTYETAVRIHLVPGLGAHRLAQLTPSHVEEWFRRHRQQGASARTIRYARTVLRAALNQARRWRLVSENVAELVEPPQHRGREIHPLTPPEARRLLEASHGHRLAALVSVGVALGLRLGEALGLLWQSVDFDAGTVRIQQALERSGGDGAARRQLNTERRKLLERVKVAPVRSAARRELRQQLVALRTQARAVQTTLRLTEPKSARSRRTIQMPAIVVAALKSHRTRQLEDRVAAGSAWRDTGLVFTTPIGSALDARNVTRSFRAILASAGLPPVRFHDLRHTAATLLLAQGVDPRTIMETLGHSQVSLTLNTYSHVLPALQGAAAMKLNAILTR